MTTIQRQQIEDQIKRGMLGALRARGALRETQYQAAMEALRSTAGAAV